jgi:hypothetical protein
MMSSVEDQLRQRLSSEEYELISQMLKLSPSRIRVFIEEKAEEVTK